MTSNELKELVKAHFSLVEADATNEIVNEESETFTEEVAEVFGEIADENSAFVLKFPGENLEVGDKVIVVTSEGQEMDAPDGEHKLADGKTIVTKDSIVESISEEAAGATEEDMAEEFDARTDAEEEGYKDGMEDAVEDIKEAIAEVVEKDKLAEESDEEVEEEMMEEVSVEDIVKEIVSAVEEEMGKMKEKMAELEEKVVKVMDVPAAESAMKATPKRSTYSSESQKGRVQQFNVETAANADRIKLALSKIKNK